MSYNQNLDQLINEINGVAIFAINKDNVITEWNRASHEMFGYSQQEAIGQNICDLIVMDHQRENFALDLASKTIYNSDELEFKKRDGSILMAIANSTYVGDSCYFMVFNMATSKTKASLERLIDRDIQNQDQLIVLSFDKKFKVASFNIFANQITGYSEKEVLGKDFLDFFVPSSYHEIIRKYLTSLKNEQRSHSSLSFPFICKNGERKVITWEKTIKSKRDGEEFFFLIALDSQESKEELNYLANYDSLTDLPNQNLLYNKLENSINRAVRLKNNLITIFLDIENFTAINHSFGFEFGNKVLKKISQRLSSSLREYDTVARFSGDEFVLIFENITDDLDAKAVTDRIKALFDEPITEDGNNIIIKTKQGVSFFPADGNDAKMLIKNAHLAMKFAKREKIDVQFFTASISDEITSKVILEKNLKKAIKNSEFYVEYQPQVDAKTKKIIGAEALIRWKDEDLVNIPPLDFIPLAEDTGLIHQIGDFVLKEAIEQATLWHKNGFDNLTISVNISGIQLMQSGLVASIKKMLDKTKFDPKFLELELTESVLMHNIDLASEIMKNFNNEGIKFAIDDFGTGYSSFGYLSKLPLSRLKIDRSFVKNLTTHKNDKVITEAIIKMAHSLNLSVVAEGVEKEQEYRYLQEQDCDTIQGYYFSKPVSAKEFTKLLERSLILEK